MKSPFCALVAALVMAGLPAKAAGNELNQAFQQVLRKPTDTQANLNYARLAEAAGQIRWALATYERILVNDPTNVEAQRGLQRMRRAIQPATTHFTAEIGGAWSSNPRQEAANGRGEPQGQAAFTMRDERTLGEVRWRTTGSAFGIYHSHEHDLNYGHGGLNTGPVIDVAPAITMHPAIGGSAAYLGDRLYYGEGTASVVFEGNQEGAYRAVRMRAAYRDYNDFFPTQHGVYADLTGKFATPYVFGNSLFILTPWVRWSDLKGTSISPLSQIEVQPGSYVEWGNRIDFNTPVTDWLIVGVNIAFSQRNYRTDLASDGTSKRKDTLTTPGALLLMPNLFAYQTGLRVEYQYQWNDSNLDTRRYGDHLVTAAIVSRF